MEKKYILTDETIEYLGHALHRIKAVKDFATISAGTLGGYVESETNLDHTGAAWVYENAKVTDSARVSGDAVVSGVADFATISGFGRVFRTTTFFRCKDNLVRCQCGCFYGTIDEFRSKVRETHGDSKYAKEYLMIADLMELHFKED